MDLPDGDEAKSEAAASVDEAESFRGRHRYADAERCARRAIALDPRFPRARSALGLVLLDTGRHAKAGAAFRGAIRLDPALTAVHRNLATAVRFRKRWPWLKSQPVTCRQYP